MFPNERRFPPARLSAGRSPAVRHNREHSMKIRHLLLASLTLAVLISASLIGQEKDTAGVKMTDAAEKWLALLGDEQKNAASFSFDDKERTNWYFTPQQDKQKKATRKGLRLEKMTAEQKEAARALVAAGTSGKGYAKAIGIMSLEAILRDLEMGRGFERNPEWYFFSVFGKPTSS